MNRSCFTALAVCCFAGCGGQATPPTFHLQVDRNPTNDDHRQQTIITFHPPPEAGLVVIEAHGHASIMHDLTKPKSIRDFVVQLVAERRESPLEGKSRVETRIGFAGHEPSNHTVDADKSLNEFLNVTITDGEFALDERVTLGTLNGRPITLVVRSRDGQVPP